MTRHTQFIGQDKASIKATLTGFVEFANWLYIPSKGLLLSFDKGRCQASEAL